MPKRLNISGGNNKLLIPKKHKEKKCCQVMAGKMVAKKKMSGDGKDDTQVRCFIQKVSLFPNTVLTNNTNSIRYGMSFFAGLMHS